LLFEARNLHSWIFIDLGPLFDSLSARGTDGLEYPFYTFANEYTEVAQSNPWVKPFGSLRRGKNPRMIDICMTQPDVGREVFGPACTSDPA